MSAGLSYNDTGKWKAVNRIINNIPQSAVG